MLNGTLLSAVTRSRRGKKVREKDATEEQLNSLEGVRRLLLRVEAVHAVFWAWPGSTSSIVHGTEDIYFATITPTQLTLTLPTLRRRAKIRDIYAFGGHAKVGANVEFEVGLATI